VPLARLLRPSAVVAYLVAGIVIGPHGFALVRAPETIVAVSDRHPPIRGECQITPSGLVSGPKGSRLNVTGNL
jgi:hypothetical protein